MSDKPLNCVTGMHQSVDKIGKVKEALPSPEVIIFLSFYVMDVYWRKNVHIFSKRLVGKGNK